MKNFSQSNEQQAILDHFNTPGKVVIKGSLLDIGANDGLTFSNSRALIECGWSAVLVEPSPKAFDKLKSLYNGQKGIYVYPYAINAHNGTELLQESGPLCSPSDIGLVSTFHASEMARFKRTVPYNPIEVKTFRWKTFLNRLKLKKFHFVSIDAEGSDLTILSQMDFDALETTCVCVEWNSKPELKKEYDYYLKDFHVIYTSGENLIYCR